MATRRDLLRTLGLVGAGAAVPVLAGCGKDGAGSGHPPGEGSVNAAYVSSALPRLPGTVADQDAMVPAISLLTTDLFRRLKATGNLVCSPYSVAYALAMTRVGARGQTATELDHVLHSPSLAALNGGLSRIDQAVTSRAGTVTRRDGSRAVIGLETANSLWGQVGEDWKRPFLDTLSRSYGAGMNQVDYTTDAAGAGRRINAWTAQRTHDRIRQIVSSGALDGDTRLVLVNAIWLKAPWEEPFRKQLTMPGDFRTAAGTVVRADLMSTKLKAGGYAAKEGFTAARLSYAGGDLAMAVVVPTGTTPTALPAVERALGGGGLATLLGSFEPGPVDVVLPKWTFRTSVTLKAPLEQLGMPTAFTDRADLSAMTAKEPLKVHAVLHQGYVAVDEDGTEAAAATAVVASTTSLEAGTPVVRADHAFLFVLYDVPTSTPLFIGRVDDPTAG